MNSLRVTLVVALLAVSIPLTAGTFNQKKKKAADINLKDIYHPWDTVEEAAPVPRKPPTSPQQMISEYLLDTVKAGDTLDKAIEEFEMFSETNHLGMTLGEEKGRIIEAAIADSSLRNSGHGPLVFLEFGAHIGDGTLRILRQLGKIAQGRECRVISFESNAEWLAVGSTLVRHILKSTGSTAKCQYIPMMLPEDVAHIAHHVKAHYRVGQIFGLLFDHKPRNFRTDLQALRDIDLVQPGTLIIADNALRHQSQMKPFIYYVEHNSVKFKLAEVADPYRDQVLVAEWATPSASGSKGKDEL